MYTGRTFTPDDALRLGLVDEIVDAATLATRAEEIARQLMSLPERAFAIAKRQLRDRTIGRAKHYAHEFDPDVLEQWSDDATHTRIREYLAKTVRK